MEQYLIKLQEQFFEATGIRADVEKGIGIKEFKDWILSRRTIGLEYTDFIDSMGFRYQDADCAEVEKGRFDTIVRPFETTLITPYTRCLKIDNERVIEGKLGVLTYQPVLMRSKYMGIEVLDQDDVNTFMTQNIYSYSQIVGWEDLHNSGNFNIICGAYGELNERDVDSKIMQLKNLRSKLITDDYKESYETDNGHYFYAIGSNRLIKRLRLGQR